MKTLWLLLTFLVLFSGCADKNAFAKFHMNEKEELGADSILNSKVKNAQNINGIVSVIYLNKVYPEKFTNEEVFYVNFYLKEKRKDFSFTLNKEKPISTQKLLVQNHYSFLTPLNTEWSRYYLVKFKKQKDILTFVFHNDSFGSDPLVFEKDE
jgi:hypothetical protein